MAETINLDKVYLELLALKKEVNYIKANMVNVDMFLTPEENEELEGALEDHKQGKTVSLEAFKKQLGD